MNYLQSNRIISFAFQENGSYEDLHEALIGTTKFQPKEKQSDSKIDIYRRVWPLQADRLK